MATVSEHPADPLAVRPWGKDATEGSKSEQYLSQRFAAAIADFKGMALVTFLLAFGVGAVGWVVVGVLAEHWLVPGGLPSWARWGWLAVAVIGTAAAVVRWLMPLLLYRVNLVYAARAIERDHPELHNDLVNAVLVKERSDEAAEAVVKSLRRRAARRLSKVPDEGVVDRTPSIRLAWILAALVCLACLYQLLAPKSLVMSAARLVAPWSGISAPSRVRIDPPRLAWRMPGEDPAVAGEAARAIDVVRGTAELVRGRQLVVTTEIGGLAADEKPELVVSPLREDGGIDTAAAAWRMPLKVAVGSRRTVIVPGDDRGLDQPVELVIAAGDARSERIRVALVDAPAVLVREIRYEYPAYMGRESETLPGQGDIRGVEGTKVTIVAAANRPLASAAVDLGCDGRRDVSLALERPEDTVGAGTFTLKLNADRSGPEFTAYRFVYRPRGAAASRSEADVVGLLEHRIEVLPDLAPEVAIEVPEEKLLRVPPDAPVTVRVRALDPDFGLASVRVETRLAGGKPQAGPELLVGGSRKSLRVAGTLVPSDLGAKPGSTLEYRAVARDTRPERPNETATEWQALQIDASAAPQQAPPEPKAGEQSEPNDGGQEPGTGQDGRQPQGGQGQQGGEGERGGPADQKNQEGGQREMPERSDDAGKQQQGEQGEQQPQGQQPQGQQQQGQQQQGQQPDPTKPGEQEGEQRGEGQQPSDQQGRKEGQQGRSEGRPGESGRDQGGQRGEQSGAGRDGDRQQGDGKGRRDGAQQGRPESGQQQGGTQQGQRQQQDGQGGREGAGEQAGGEQAGGEQAGGEQAGGEQAGGEQAGGEQAGGEQGRQRPEPAVASDGTNDGEAIERILENRRRTAAGDEREPGAGGKPRQGEQRGDEQRERGEQAGQPSDQQGQQQPGAKPDDRHAERQPDQQSREPGQKQGEQPGDRAAQRETERKDQKPEEAGRQQAQESQCQNADGKPCGKSGCSSCNGGSKSGGGSSSGQGQQGQGQPGQGQPGQGQPGQGQPGQGQPGQGQQGQGQPGQGQQGQGQQGQGQQGQGQQGQGQQGQGQQGQGQQGQGQQGQGQQG
ncbi:MAG: hypothetical protein ACKOCX_05495, partial [Planctomycetota bacterium]